MDSQLAPVFREFSAKKLEQLLSRIQDCVAKLTPEQVWARGHDAENAVGNLLLHLAGNCRQWILAGVGGQPDQRVRDQEFGARGGLPARELVDRLTATVTEAVGLIRGLSDDRLGEKVRPQGYEVMVLEAVYHVVEHFAQHTAQVIFATKLFTGEDLGYYRHLSSGKSLRDLP